MLAFSKVVILQVSILRVVILRLYVTRFVIIRIGILESVSWHFKSQRVGILRFGIL